ncbi:MAG: DUF4199 domain-containing protein [Bacteroidia bacterium]|nr:DUF4199 domain-containing protein [Bacteroidia bacterium]
MSADRLGYRTHWRLVLLAGALIATLHITSFWAVYQVPVTEGNLRLVGVISKLPAWLATLAIYVWVVWQARRRDGVLPTFRGLYYVVLTTFLWSLLDGLNGVVFEYYVDPGHDLHVLEVSRSAIEQSVAQGEVNAEVAKGYLDGLDARIAAAKAGSPSLWQLLLPDLSWNLMVSSIYGLVLGVLFRPVPGAGR